MSLDSGEKQKVERSLPKTASQQAAARKSDGDNARASTGKQPRAGAADGKSVKSKAASSGDDTPAQANSPAATAVAEPAEDKAAAKARAKEEKARAKEEKAAAKALAKAEKEERKKAAKAERQRVASGGIKDLFILHVEKIVLGLCAIAAVVLIYMGYTALELQDPHSPEQLRAGVAKIDQTVKDRPFSEAEKDFTIPDFNLHVSRAKVNLSLANLPPMKRWDPPFTPPTKRGQPEIFAPVDPIAIPGVGLFFVNQPAAKPEDAAKGAGADGADGAGAPVAKAAPAKAAGDAGDLRVDGEAPVGGPAPPKVINLGAEDVRKLGGVVPPAPVEDPLKPGAAPPLILEGRRWVAIVARLPKAIEQAEFDAQLANAFDHNPERDTPVYVEVGIRRLEVAPGTPDDASVWEGKALEDAKKAGKFVEWTQEQFAQYRAELSTWLLRAPEVAPAKFIRDDSARLVSRLTTKEAEMGLGRPELGLGVMAKPLGPLAAQPWDTWAKHLGLYEAPVLEEKEEEAKDEAPAEPAPAPVPAPPVAADPNNPGFVPMPLPQTPEKKKEAAKRTKPKRLKVEAPVEYQLVRVFDYTVQPGKQYRYRLKFTLRNPNFGIEKRNLQDPAKAETAWVFSPWSQSTNTVAVPNGESVLADSVLPPGPVGQLNGPNNTKVMDVIEPSARIVLKMLNFDAARYAFAMLQLRRGAAASGSGQQVLYDPATYKATQGDGLMKTDLVLADFRGGEKIESKLNAPAEMLFIDAAGQLVVQNSLQDEPWVKAIGGVLQRFGPPPGAAPEGAEGAGGATPQPKAANDQDLLNQADKAKGR